jgi:hypothetical protein
VLEGAGNVRFGALAAWRRLPLFVVVLVAAGATAGLRTRRGLSVEASDFEFLAD